MNIIFNFNDKEKLAKTLTIINKFVIDIRKIIENILSPNE